jgi:hypothetical protein
MSWFATSNPPLHIPHPQRYSLLLSSRSLPSSSLLARVVVESSPLVNNTVTTLLEFQDYLFGDGPFPVQSEFPVRAMATAHHA